jgi:two-component system, OmpR family, KDP operon response regulator KdpE
MNMTREAVTYEVKALDTFKTRVLLIDNDQAMRRHLRFALKAQDFVVYEAVTAEAGLEQLSCVQPDIVLLDFQMPDRDTSNLKLITAIHAVKRIPILILSIQDSLTQKIEALDAGAEDYIVKPFSMEELLARMRVALRRTRVINNSEVFSSGNLKVDFVYRKVWVDKQVVSLTPTEYELLQNLIAHPDQVITQQQLWDKIHGDLRAFKAHTLRVHFSNLRHKVEVDSRNPQHILTEVGVGYRFQTKAFSAKV